MNEDGRRARRDRNKYAVVDAYLDLIRHGNPRPSIAEVAEHSGISHRSVFRYFSDQDELARTAIERQQAVARPLVPIDVDPDAPLDLRIERFVDRRLDLYEAIAPVARLSRSLVSMQPVLAAELAITRRFLRTQLHQLFRTEIDSRPKTEARDVLAALDAFTSFESVELLRNDQLLKRGRTAATLRRGMHALLTT